MGRAPCCDKANVKKGPWAPEEDAKLKDYMEKHGTGGNWIALPQKAGLKRCGKSCRLRWLNYLRPNIKHGDFTEEEDKIICSLFANIGSRWSVIASQLPGRTDNDIKNYWNTKLKKKLMAMAPPHQSQRKPPPLFQSSHQTSPLLSSSPSLSSLLKDFIGGSNYHHYFNNPSKSFTGFDPIPPIPSNILLGNSSSTTLATNSTTLLEDLVSPPMQCYQPVKDGSFLTFGSEANCTLSSDVGYIQSYISSGYEENQKFMISYGNNNNGGENLSQWTTEKPNGGYYCGGETPLDYRLEDEDVNKQLISSTNNSGSSIIKGCSSNNNNNNFLIDENKTQEKVMMYSYY